MPQIIPYALRPPLPFRFRGIHDSVYTNTTMHIVNHPRGKFFLGDISIVQAGGGGFAISAFRELLHRHQCGDCGDVDAYLSSANGASLQNLGPVLSIYKLPGLKVTIITSQITVTTELIISQEG